MTTTIFLTGDETYPPDVAQAIAASTLSQLALKAIADGRGPLEIWTGDRFGFELGVRDIGVTLGFRVYVIATSYDERDEVDWDDRHDAVGAIADNVVIVHNEPLSSPMIASAMKVLAGKVSVVSAV